MALTVLSYRVIAVVLSLEPEQDLDFTQIMLATELPLLKPQSARDKISAADAILRMKEQLAICMVLELSSAEEHWLYSS